jgi:hypothetical protein
LRVAVILAVGVSTVARAEDVTIDLSVDEAIALATRLLVEGRTEQAASVVRALEQSFPDHPQVLFLDGQIALQEGRYADAVEAFRRILSTIPGWFVSASSSLGRCSSRATSRPLVTTSSMRSVGTCRSRCGKMSTASSPRSTQKLPGSA